MEIAPRYDGDPIVTVDGDPAAVAEPFLRQRRRLAATLGTFTAEQWATQSRCDEWRVQDVVAHLTGTDGFWAASIKAGLAGAPSTYLAGFDPKATPAAMVDAVRAAPPAETLSGFLAATDALCDLVSSLDDAGWRARAESPAGHVGMSAVVHHALWDAWIHERDVSLPLGLGPEEHDDEILASLRYAAVLSPMFALQTGNDRTGALVLEVDKPSARVVVTVDGAVRVGDGDAPADAVVLRGGAVELLEALSVRAPLPHAVPDDQAWLVDGLTRVFETAQY
jgi:uncharacterized protein (TIGR03083 family)